MSKILTSRAGFTLLETMIALAVFVVGGLGMMEVMGYMNNNATANRAMTAARLLVGAKIAKAQTDTYTVNNGTVPVGCQQPTSGTLANQDPNDPFDIPATSVPIITYADSSDYLFSNKITTITGTMNQYVSTYEAASGSLLITFTLNFTYRGKTYTVTQSTIRTPDQI